jgi:putative ABC transport system permease protein
VNVADAPTQIVSFGPVIVIEVVVCPQRGVWNKKIARIPDKQARSILVGLLRKPVKNTHFSCTATAHCFVSKSNIRAHAKSYPVENQIAPRLALELSEKNMLKSFLQIAVRNFTKRKGYSILNLIGLTIGITCCLLIFKYVAYERSYDSYNRNATRIFRVQETDYAGGRLEASWAPTSPGVGPALKKDFPEIQNFCRLIQWTSQFANLSNNTRFHEEKVFMADTSALSILQIPLLKGNPATALTGVSKVILSQRTARKYFGDTDPIGKTMYQEAVGRQYPLEVTGVFADLPANSHLVIDMLLSYPTIRHFIGADQSKIDQTETSWGWSDYYTYIQLKPGLDWKALQAKLPDFTNRHFNSLPENKSRNDYYILQLYPLTDIHLYSHCGEEAEASGDGNSVSFLFLIGFFIAAIAWVNYINLATARSLERAREVGVRKVLGALRTDLIRQFLVESLLVNTLALTLALIISWSLTAVFNRLTGRTIVALPLTYTEIFAALFITGTFLSGIYPAFVLSRYNPVSVLKGIFKNTTGGQLLRKALIIGQFAASILLIAGTIIVYNQVHYMRSQALGININQTLVLNGTGSMNDSVYATVYPAFKQDILRQKDVTALTSTSDIPGNEITWSTQWQRQLDPKKNYTLRHLSVDYDYFNYYGLQIVAGRTFDKSFPTDKDAVVLTEGALKELGYAKPEDALGEKLHANQDAIGNRHVIGVAKDFHQEGLQKAIAPLAIMLNPGAVNYYSIRIDATNTPQTVAAIQAVWQRHFPSDPFRYFFLDDFFNKQYAENERFGTVFGLFAGLAIFIACLGLLGLSAYNVLQRTKEIGIRKVLGASEQHLLYILSRDFLLLVVFAFVIAVPITWWAMDSWLQEFAYRIHIGWWTFAIAGALAFSIALITVGAQALKASFANPVKSLRTE